MTELDNLIAKAYQSQGADQDANKVYTALLRTNLFVPSEKLDSETQQKLTALGESFQPLFIQQGSVYYMLAFDTLERLQAWAGDTIAEINVVQVSGREIVASMGADVHLGLNVTTAYYKEFIPAEIHRLKTIVAKIDAMANKT